MILRSLMARTFGFGIRRLHNKSDKLGRDVLSNTDRKKIMKNNAPPKLFMAKAGQPEISVNRLTPEPGQEPPADGVDFASDADLAVIGDRRVAELKRLNKISPQQKLYGWAVLSVEDTEQNGRRVFSSPEKGNPSHAEILLPIMAMFSKQIRKRHARELAKKTKWRSRPAAKQT